MLKRIIEVRDRKTMNVLGTYHMVRPCAKKVKELMDKGVDVLIISYCLRFEDNGEVMTLFKRKMSVDEILKRIGG